MFAVDGQSPDPCSIAVSRRVVFVSRSKLAIFDGSSISMAAYKNFQVIVVGRL